MENVFTLNRIRINAMLLAPDAVQIVESDSLTGGYRSKFLLFHKLFHAGVENDAANSTSTLDVNRRLAWLANR